MGASASMCPPGVEARIYEKLEAEFEEQSKQLKVGKKERKALVLPESLEECLAFPAPNAEDEAVKAKLYEKLETKYEQVVSQYTVPSDETPLKALPEAVEQSVYVHERWPLMLDTSGQGYRFLKYQNGQFILVANPLDVQPENLRKALVSCIKHGTMLVLNFDEKTVDLEPLFDDDHFPREVLRKGDLFKDETLKRILRPEAGDGDLEHFLPKDEFKLVVVTKVGEEINIVAGEYNLAIVTVLDPNQKNDERKSRGDAGGIAIAEAFGAKEVKRNSTKLVEV